MLREINKQNGKYLNEKLRKYIFKKLIDTDKTLGNVLIRDFSFFTFLAGNDFLPKMMSQIFSENCIAINIGLYAQNYASYGPFFAADMFTINWESFRQFIKSLVSSATATYKTYHINFYQKRNERLLPKYESLTTDRKRAEFCYTNMVNYPEENDSPISIVMNNTAPVDDIMLGKGSFSKYSARYYKHYDASPSDKSRKTIVKEFMKTIIWVKNYYWYRIIDWKYHYPYRMAPLMLDLLNFFPDTQELKRIEMQYIVNTTYPYSPITQALYRCPKILIRSTYGDISFKLYKAYKKNYLKEELDKMFPNTKKLQHDYLYKHKYWMAKLIIPIDVIDLFEKVPFSAPSIDE